VDDSFADAFSQFVSMTCTMLIKFTAIVLFAPIFAFPGLLIALAGAKVGNIYVKAQLPVKRLMSVSRAPVLEHFGMAIGALGKSISLIIILW
jgi:hypothetical protein